MEARNVLNTSALSLSLFVSIPRSIPQEILLLCSNKSRGSGKHHCGRHWGCLSPGGCRNSRAAIPAGIACPKGISPALPLLCGQLPSFLHTFSQVSPAPPTQPWLLLSLPHTPQHSCNSERTNICLFLLYFFKLSFPFSHFHLAVTA